MPPVLVSPPVPPEKLFPKIQDIKNVDSKIFSKDLVQDIKVLLMTATEIELRGIMGYLKPKDGKDNIVETFVNGEKVYIGKYGKCPVIVGMSAPGKARQDLLVACLVTTKLMNIVKPRYVIAVGICYGMDESKTSSGDVIVSNLICDFTSLRVENKKDAKDGYTLQMQHRKAIPPVGATLLQVFFPPIKYIHTQGGKEVEVRCGPIITRPDLVDDPIYKEYLKHLWPNALGGEREGAAIMAAAERVPSEHRVEVIVIKAICDWGDGKKSKGNGKESKGNGKESKDADWKHFSSHAAARYVHHQMNKPTGTHASLNFYIEF